MPGRADMPLLPLLGHLDRDTRRMLHFSDETPWRTPSPIELECPDRPGECDGPPLPRFHDI